MTVRRAQPADAAALSAFGRRIFVETFAHENTPQDLAAYLDGTYTVDRQLAEIADPAIEILLVEREDGLAGFAQVRTGEAPPCVEGPRPIELWRLYVDARWQGTGLAAELMAAVEHACRTRGGQTLWLGVWERNFKAQAFYRKHGFTVAGSQLFVLGSDPQRDLVMVKALPAQSESGTDDRM